MESTTRTPLHERDLTVQRTLRDLTAEQLRQLDCHAANKGMTREELVVQIVGQSAKSGAL